MKKLLLSCWVVLIACLASSTPALAHHGFASYDETKTVSLKGTVTDYELATPHSMLAFDVKNESGKVENWICEAPTASQMRDQGWLNDSLKAGDVVTVYFHPAKNGSHAAVDLIKVEFHDGHVLWGHKD